jgi:hypothetical protein
MFDIYFQLVPGLVVAGLAYLIGKLLRFMVRRISSWHYINILSKSKILYVYDSQSEAEEQMYKDAKNSKIMYIFANFEIQFTLVTNNFYKLLKEKNGDIKIMFADAKLSNIGKREKELNMIFPPETYEGMIKTMTSLQKNNRNIQFLLHNEFVRNKFYIFDNVMYLGFRLRDELSENTQLWRINKDSYQYKTFFLQFEDYWEKYTKEQNIE